MANAAREPEIADLAACLAAMGARITGSAPTRLTIEGVQMRCTAPPTPIIPDRIETGTYACAAAITGGTVHAAHAGTWRTWAAVRCTPCWARPGLDHPGRAGRRAGCAGCNGLHGVDAMTEPFPGFPTDMQAQFMALMSVAEGASMVTETIFENRFMHVPELNRMGARINVHGSSAIVRGVAGPVRSAGDGDGFAGQRPPWCIAGLAARRRDGGEPGVSPGPRLRSA